MLEAWSPTGVVVKAKKDGLSRDERTLTCLILAIENRFH
ncbi:hypothetical protein DB30_02000 [Enhygromyxa salina]|uniref:Uncharacterized protein n=1 Tax=Enhygromyxa salina TaxID=215803 RepID=A0A0C2A3Z5_9BACT|nr:hypothetical protein DB30_02000 [Enhygromyxa salina]